ncbi:hypothetical protein [Kosakonia sacchari]|uniref:hypothetical protein n=1 Tax=Kosakonia sacchari TaxID=1158459 RepID=UPI0020B1308A|nr:hypothetical protein [Kosakonia sacchari]
MNEVESLEKEYQDGNQKTCFIIMPIADHPDYDNGHFNRVYEHLVKPACLKAGYKAIRADESKASHMIMFDILKKIIDCDMAICDLSSKNANVFYELGLRQAFNKKTILITDGLTNTPFDITGFRYVQYNPNLRIDTVIRDVSEVSAMLKETEAAPEDDVNSIIKLLRIQPAHIDRLQLSAQDSVIFDMIKNLDSKINKLTSTPNFQKTIKRDNNYYLSFADALRLAPKTILGRRFRNTRGVVGVYIGETENGDHIFKQDGQEIVFEPWSEYLDEIYWDKEADQRVDQGS